METNTLLDGGMYIKYKTNALLDGGMYEKLEKLLNKIIYFILCIGL